MFSAEWSAGDALNYVGAMIGAISTFVLSWVAYKQNEKLQGLEDNNYIASNSCMVLIDKILVTPKASIPVNYELHEEQILKEKDNKDKLPLGYNIEVNLKKVEPSIQAIPSLIYISSCLLFVGDNEVNGVEHDIWAENIRNGFTRTAICESGIAFNCTLMISRDKKEKFEKCVQLKNNTLMIEFEFEIITDKYVMTKGKCRADCVGQNDNGIITWKSTRPIVFFYGHELKDRNKIQVLEGE